MIVHGRDLLLNDQFPDKFRKIVNQKLEARGIELVLGDYVATFPENGGGEVLFRSGKKLQADLVVRIPASVPLSIPHKLQADRSREYTSHLGSDVRTQTKHCLDIRCSGSDIALT